MTRIDWLNIARCARERRNTAGLHGHWSHWNLPRYGELMQTEYALQCKASKAVGL